MAKVMLVEDDNNLREIYEARLQAEGYTIVSAKDGEEALVVAKQEKPDLIISDVMMPKISGFEMLDILRNTDELKATKVVMLTALGQTDDQQRADKLGADRYLVKSQVTLEDIVKVAHELLEDGAPAIPTASEPPTAPTTTPTPPPAAPAATPPAADPPADPTPAPPTPAPEPPAPPTPPAPEPPAAAEIPASPSVSAPAPAPAPTPAPAPSPAVASDTAAADNMAQTTSQEEASVDAQIANFVQGATTEATPPAGTLVTAPAGSTPSDGVIAGVAGQAPVAAAAPATNPVDDKLMADAVKTLETSTQTAPEAAASAPQTVAPTVQPPAEPTAAPAATADDDSKTDAVTVAHKKVIQPIDSSPKQDIASLVALEEAKEAAAAPPPPPTATIATADQGPTSQPLGTIQKSNLGTPAMTAEPTAAPTPADLEQPSGNPLPAPHQSAGDGNAAPDDPNSIAL